MLPITSFNPGDTVAFPNGNGAILVGAADAGAKILFYNESPYNLDINFLNGSRDTLHAWEAHWWPLDADTKQLEWQILSSLNASTAPISIVMGTLYGRNESVPGTYPVSLFRQTNVGNTVNTGGSGISQLTNTGNIPGTNVVNVQPSDATTPTIKADNSGNFAVSGDNAGVLTTLLQLIAGASPGVILAATNILTNILGNLRVGQSATIPSGTLAVGNTDSQGAQFLAWSNADATTPMYARANSATQSADLLECQNSSGVKLMWVDKAGNVGCAGTITGSSTGFIFQSPTGVHLAKLDASGNLVIKGSLTQNGAP